MTPRPPPSAEHFTQVVTEVDRLVQQGCAEISALSRMALLWLEMEVAFSDNCMGGPFGGPPPARAQNPATPRWPRRWPPSIPTH